VNPIFKSALFLALFSALASCKATHMNIYDADYIDKIELRRDAAPGVLHLKIRPKMDSVYAMAGAKISFDDDMPVLQLVRCHMKSKCPVDMVPEPRGETFGEYDFKIKSTTNTIAIDYPSGRQIITLE